MILKLLKSGITTCILVVFLCGCGKGTPQPVYLTKDGESNSPIKINIAEATWWERNERIQLDVATINEVKVFLFETAFYKVDPQKYAGYGSLDLQSDLPLKVDIFNRNKIRFNGNYYESVDNNFTTELLAVLRRN